MFFIKKKETSYFRYSLEKKVDFYFDVFFGQLKRNMESIEKHEKAIKYILFQELSSYNFQSGRYYASEGTKGIRKLSSDLGHLISDWTIDWTWIIHHITLDYQNIGIALHLIDDRNLDKILVYKYVPDKYYDFAKELYLKDLITKEPKLFKLQEILRNGHGLKPNIKSFVPLVGVTLWKGFDNEYWDLTELKIVRDGYYWDVTTQSFKLKEITERKVIRTSKIRIYVGGVKKYEV
jgi:hypothetical protein